MSQIVAPFDYCPRCGRPAACANAREFRCAPCGFRYFHNVAAAVGAFILHDGHLLCAVRAHEPAVGTLNLPGGFVEPGESLEQGLLRELCEELGVSALPGAARYLFSLPNAYPFDGVTYATCDSFYLIECAERPQLEAGDDVGALLWLALDALDLDDFGLNSVRAAVGHFLLSNY